MWGGVPASLYINEAKKQGIYTQLTLLETVPEYEIDEEHLVRLFAGIKCKVSEYGNPSGHVSHVDHPAFTTLRNHLGRDGYVEIEHQYINGDVVLKEFILNGKRFHKGDSFPCASAMKAHLKYKE